MSVSPENILNFWVAEIGPDRWFKADPALDAMTREQFLGIHEQAARGGLKEWEETPEGVLCLMLLLDQFPRMMFRGTVRAYATDEQALELARTAIIRHFDDRIDKSYKLLFYLPFAHAENAGDQRLASFYIRERTKEQAWIDISEKSLRTIRRFGRFPDRNEVLGRESTPEETEFLKAGGDGA
jgi:uncharacterized protein (DUF924 family)